MSTTICKTPSRSKKTGMPAGRKTIATPLHATVARGWSISKRSSPASANSKRVEWSSIHQCTQHFVKMLFGHNIISRHRNSIVHTASRLAELFQSS